MRLYADDTTAYASDISPVVLEYIINSDLQVVCTWLQHNYLQINATKTQAMAIGPVNYRYTINLQDNNIELTDSLKILGVTLDERITFKPYKALSRKVVGKKCKSARDNPDRYCGYFQGILRTWLVTPWTCVCWS